MTTPAQKVTPDNEFAWLIERSDSPSYDPQYLCFYGTLFIYGGEGHGLFCWHNTVNSAIRFSRKEDAQAFITAFRILSNSLPHGQTIQELRAGDLFPRVCEHGWPSVALRKGADQ